MLTIPGPNQVVYKRFVAIIIRNYDPAPSPRAFYDPGAMARFLNFDADASICFHLLSSRTLLSSRDSDLEAFSHNPTDDSFAALTVQSTALPNI